jgi:hypothetical protein
MLRVDCKFTVNAQATSLVSRYGAQLGGLKMNQKLTVTVWTRRVFVSTVVLSLVACAAKPQLIPLVEPSKSDFIVVEDLRPAIEDESRMFSLVIFDPAYGTRRLSGQSITPKPIRVLQHRYYEKFGKARASLRVHHLVVYSSQQAVARGGAGGSTGLLGSLLTELTTDNSGRVRYGSTVIKSRDAFEATSGDKEFFRAYPGTDLDGYAVYIETEVEGKRLLTQTLVRVPQREPIGDHVAQAVDQAIRYHVDQL